MLLKKLIKGIPKSKENIIVSGLSSNSKEIKKNYIFFAIKGSRENGEKFIKDAIDRGASVVVCSKNNKIINNKGIYLIKTNKVRNLLSEFASKFYHSKPRNIIAVTGTNGKTSVADIFYQILNISKISAATIGTLGIKYNGKKIKTSLTTPDTITLHKNLHFLKKNKIDNVMIESSSHGLEQKRLNNINFKGGIFTNFSQDHLDYHKNMNTYLNAKLILFKNLLSKKSTIISDKEIRPYKSLKKIAKNKQLKLLDISKEREKIKNYFLNLRGEFKIKNYTMAILAAKLCGLKDKKIYSALKKIKDVSGRLELAKKYENNIKVYIDFAHTPDALKKTINILKNEYGDNVSLVFGCGGERDFKKRAIMSRIANNNCKKIYVTDDNPRNEDPKKIRKELLKYISKRKSFEIGNRKLAIKLAIENAEPNEIILVAGKGHEDKQIYKNKILNISDKKIIKGIRKKFKIISRKKQNFLQNKLILKSILGKKISLNCDGLSIDSRLIKKDNLFLALKGRKNNGNKFINSALKKGAGCIVTTSPEKKNNKKVIKVQNSISFLNLFAKFKRQLSSTKIIAVTGSAGKTSIKNLLKNLLNNYGKTYCSPKSFNNHLGVPVSLSNLSIDDKFGIFEIGMSKAGEIKALTKLVRPHIGLITNIGEAHLENFKNIYGIAKAKSEIIEKIESGGTIILNRDDKYFHFLSKKANKHKLKTLSFGNHKNSDICLKKIITKGSISRIFVRIKNQTIDFNVKDLNINNVLSSLAVLKSLEVNILKIKQKFVNFESLEGRGKKYTISRYNKKFKLIDESYNANPLSVKIAIHKLKSIKKNQSKKYLILGDMLELGSRSKKYHEELSRVINRSDIDKVFVKGNKTIFTYKYLNKDKRGNILQNNEDIDLSLKKIIENNDYLLIKGSNATGLNDFSKKMIKGI